MSTPKTLGPYNSTSTPALVAGTAIAVAIDPDTAAIQVHNDSPYRVYVAFDGAVPTASVAATGNYQGIAGPYGHPVIMVRSQYQSPFLGMVWLMPVNVSSSLASTGTPSTLAEIHVDTFGPGDALPQSWAMPRQQDLTSQPRVVAVPMGLSHFNAGQWAVGDPSPLVLQTATISAKQLTVGVAPIYLYYAQIYPTSSTTNAMAFNLEVQWRNAGGGALGSPFVMARGAVLDNVTNQTTAPWVFAPVWPFAAVGAFPAGATKADLQMSFVSGTRMTVHYTIAFWMDPTNAVGDQDIGVQALFAGTSPLF